MVSILNNRPINRLFLISCPVYPMEKNVITKQQLEHLSDLHRIVAEQKIQRGEWKLVEIFDRGIK